ncbi:MAG: class II fructose-bisphosphate aldolase [Dehalococcoidales bacterium]|nr:class II fructose-bisphosphate aldolase [Dehalococcoidales bacterium]
MSDDIGGLIKQAVFEPDLQKQMGQCRAIRKMAMDKGIYPASIQGLYEAAGRGKFDKMTVPAINIRMLTYDVSRAVFQAAMKDKVGALIFEIARSEIGYTKQSPAEYVACVMAAAIKEGYRGPVFIQGDHYQFKQSAYEKNPEEETNAIKKLVQDSIEAGFYNIDIDASTLVDISKDDLSEQQAKNSQVTSEMTKFIRGIEPKGVTVSVGGEIGEIGKGNSTVEDLRAFMDGYLKLLPQGSKGISKISVQTGTTHGGVVLPDGSIAKVKIAFDTLKELSNTARKEYKLGGAVQHGASTLPDEAFDNFPKMDTIEVHLATGFQNIVYDSPHFPKDLLARAYRYLDEKCIGERKSGDTDEQFHYNTRKKALGEFKKEMWNLPSADLQAIMQELEERFTLMFEKLNTVDTEQYIKEFIK